MFLFATVFLAALALVVELASAATLPSIAWDSAEAQALFSDSSTPAAAGGKWWIRAGDLVYHAPSKDSELSPNVDDYYSAIGSDAALTDDLRSHRVGGAGRWHIFHIPAEGDSSDRGLNYLEYLARSTNRGSSLLQTSQHTDLLHRDRRSSLSRLNRLKHGAVLRDQFPVYTVDSAYVHPLSAAGQQVETVAVAKVTPESYQNYLTKLTSLKSRSWESEADTAKAVALVKEELEALGLKVCKQPFEHDSRSLTNVMAYVPGQTSESIIVGAHYDSRPYAGPAPGAVDNGSGVAAMLAIAKAFKASGVVPKKSVLFAAFAGEEAGLLGSEAFAKDLSVGGQTIPKECRPATSSFIQLKSRSRSTATNGISGAIIMDEIGWLSPNLKAPTVNLESYDTSSEMMQHMVQSSKTHNSDGLTVVHSNHPFGSDHMSFLERKMQSVLTINGDDDKYPNYHSSGDTIDNVNIDYATKITKMNMGALVRMAGLNEAPATETERKLRRETA